MLPPPASGVGHRQALGEMGGGKVEESHEKGKAAQKGEKGGPALTWGPASNRDQDSPN